MAHNRQEAEEATDRIQEYREGGSLKGKAAKGFLWSGLNNSTMQVLNAVFGIILAQKLNQEDYGLIGMLTIFTLIANSLQDSGFVVSLTNKRDATHADYNSVFWFNVVVSITLYVVLYTCAPLIAAFFDEPILTPLSRYYFLGFVIASLSIVPRALLFRHIRQKELAIMGMVSLLVSGCVGITMAYCGMAYWGLATQTLVFNIMVTILSWTMSHWRPSRQVSMRPIREMFGFSSKMLITNIFNQVNNNIFSILLGRLYTKVEVGTYTQANKWNTMGSSTITGMVQGVAQPTFVQVGDDHERLRRTFSKMLRFTCLVSFPVMFGLSLVAPEFILVLLPAKWLPSAHLMRILCIGGAFLPIATLYFNLIIARGKSDIYMWNVIAQGCAILLSTLLIHRFCSPVTISISWWHHTVSCIDMMVVSYVIIIMSWTFLWHHFLYREIHYPLRSAIKDIAPFMLISVATMTATYLITSPISNIHLLLATRIAIAATVYIIIIRCTHVQILQECIKYIWHKKKGKK